VSKHYRLYNSAAWKRRRLAQLTGEPLCRFHLRRGETVSATIADHDPPHRGDHQLFFTGPLQSLCKACHDSLKQAQEKTGFSKEAGLDGFPVDPLHPFNRPRP
jgi:hypothetical protein